MKSLAVMVAAAVLVLGACSSNFEREPSGDKDSTASSAPTVASGTESDKAPADGSIEGMVDATPEVPATSEAPAETPLEGKMAGRPHLTQADRSHPAPPRTRPVGQGLPGESPVLR